MKRTTKAQKIEALIADRATVLSSYEATDTSTQAELRLSVRWLIRYPVDRIAYPKRLDQSAQAPGSPWERMRALEVELADLSTLARDHRAHTYAASSRTKSGAALRAEAEAVTRAHWEGLFLTAHRQATGERALARIRAGVSRLQAQQKPIVAEMRAENSRYLAARKAAKSAAAQADAAAIAEGRFWDASREAVKDLFDPPFAKNHLADVSSAWRAALYLECESAGYKNRAGDWRHKLVGTGRGYLCGIDDNGDQWGHRVDLSVLPTTEHGDQPLDATVEDAMAELFHVPVSALALCERQGDLLFRPMAIPGERYECSECGMPKGWGCTCPDLYGESRFRRIPAVELHPHDGPWEIRESHRIEAQGLERNGRFFRAAAPITVTHTSHAPVTLPAGSYRLYTLDVPDAD